MHEIEVWVVVDESGDYRAGEDASTAAERFNDDIGNDGTTPTRLVCVKLKVPAPKPIELSGVVPEEPSGEGCELSVQ